MRLDKCKNYLCTGPYRRILSMNSKKMKHLFFIAISGISMLLINSDTFAVSKIIPEKNAVFDISSKIFLDGKLLSAPEIIARSSQSAAIFVSDKSGMSSLKIQLIARERSENAITIKFDIQYKNGNTHIETKPELVLAPEHEGVITLSNAQHPYEIRVLVKLAKN